MCMMYAGMCVSWHMYGGEELCVFCALLLPMCGFHGWTRDAKLVQRAPLPLEQCHQPQRMVLREQIYEE